MSIKPLSSRTIKLINSTQVIQSIYAAVKELVENSLDAQARNIEVTLVDNGLSMIEVKDNGVGISKEDAQFMGLPSYTSKIADFNDLDFLSTYGFRGEALTSICQVSEVTVSTKTANDETVTCYKLDHEGYVISSELSHGVTGTTVRMNNLFKTMPVRRNIINSKKRINQEIKAVELLLKKYAICKPSVRFVLRVNSANTFMKPSHKNLIDSIKSVFGAQIYSKLYYINKNFDETDIQLFIPKRTIIQDSAQVVQSGLQFICVNDRPIKSKEIDKQINKRISEYFSESISSSRKYIFCLILKVNPSVLDVNLEPNKDQVFLQNESMILSELDSILREYYDLQETQTQSDIENINVNGNLNEMEDVEAEKDVPVVKKRKIDEKKKKSIDTNLAEKIVEPVTKPTEEFLKSLSQPVLSDADSDDESKKKSKENNDKVEQMEIDAAKSSESETFDLGTNLLKKHQIERLANEEDRLSQLPVVDLGDDFDWREIVKKCNENLKKEQDEINATETEKQVISDMAWSKGQVPGLQAGVSIGIFNNTSNVENGKQQDQNQDSEMFEIGENVPRIDDDEASTSKNNTPTIKEFNWEQNLKNPKKQSSNKLSTPRSHKVKKSAITPNQSKIPFAGDNACLSAIGPSAFSMYCTKARMAIVKENPEFTPAEVAAELNKQWKSLNQEEREHYRDLANEQKQNATPPPVGVTPKKPRLQVSEFEREKNRKQLVHLLGNMKSNKADVKNESMIMRTFVPWTINFPMLKDKFRKLVIKDIPMEVPKTPIIIGSLNSLLWIAKFASSLYVFDISELHAQLNVTDCDINKINSEYVNKIVKRWLAERNSMNVFHVFHKMNNKSD